MIDLGSELADYEPELDRADDALPTMAETELTARDRYGLVSLADLEQQGFNTTPPPGFVQRQRAFSTLRSMDDVLRTILSDENIAIDAHTWFGTDPAVTGFYPTGKLGDWPDHPGYTVEIEIGDDDA